MVDIHQCPRCELRFLTRHELLDHLAEAHPGAVEEPPTAGPVV